MTRPGHLPLSAQEKHEVFREFRDETEEEGE